MDEDEELFRLMNEEDDFYMGDTNENEKSPEQRVSSKNNNTGCVGNFVFFILFVLTFPTLRFLSFF